MNINSQLETSTHLQGRTLILARFIWWAIVLLVLVYNLASLIHAFENSGVYLGMSAQTLAERSGLSVSFVNAYGTTSDFSIVFIYLAIGVIIFWRKPNDWLVIWISLTIITAGPIAFGAGQPLATDEPFWQAPFILLFVVSTVTTFIVFFIFPDGNLFPRWIRWAIIPYAVFELLRALERFTSLDLRGILFQISLIIWGGGLIAQIYRYQRVSNPTQRQQTKWAVLGLAVMVVVSFGYSVLPVESFTGPLLVLQMLVIRPVLGRGPWIIPVLALMFSVLRYRLWNIDFFINRSLVYGALTALLVALLGLGLFIVSQLFQNFTGGPLVAVAVSAAIFGAIFQPTRRQLQRLVDQRFYNIKIDYQKTPPQIQIHEGAIQGLKQTHFGAYQNLELIGRGGMAEVYKSMHPELGKPVAIKILPPHLASESDFRQRFTRESQVVAKLQHPNIVRIFDYGEHAGTHYMVMEYLVGKDLGEYIKTKGKLSLIQTLPLVHQIAAALNYAHAQGLVHRDIKPSNVMLDTDSQTELRAVLTDFGIAKIMSAHTAITSTGGMLGTLDYIAPEQIQALATVDSKADIYAFGVMVYQMLTGELPFKYNNPGALLIAHLTQPPPNPREIVPDLPSHVVSAIQRAMMKKPEERFATATEFALEISGN